LVVLEPVALGARAVGGGIWVAANEPVEGAVWCPPSRLDADWDAVATIDAARALLGPGYDDERAAAVDALGAYLEELAELRRAGAPPPSTPWCELDAETRARLLAAHGVAAPWSSG